MAGEGDSGGGVGRLNLAALTAGATGLVTVLGGLSLTGTVGRILRDQPTELAWALGLVLAGSAMLAAAGLPVTRPFFETLLTVLGLEVVLMGLLIAVIFGIRASGESRVPTITSQLVGEGRRVKGNVSATNLKSGEEFAMAVEGLEKAADGETRTSTLLHKALTGPNDAGKVDLSFETPIPAGRFDIVRVTAGPSSELEGDAQADPCVARDRHACLQLPLAPVPSRPRLHVTWEGTGSDRARLRVRVATRNAPILGNAKETSEVARVALVVKASAGGRTRAVYESILQPTGRGYVNETVGVPIPDTARLVCVKTLFVNKKKKSLPWFDCDHGKQLDVTNGTVVRLRPPRTATADP